MGDRQRARLLVVDDDAKLANVIRRTLSPEHDVVALTSGEEALGRIAAGESFDLILCDLLMPGVDGVAFYERLDSVAPAMRRRVMMMTGGAFTLRTLSFLEEVAVPRLEKPFDITTLRRVVNALLGRS